MILDVLNGPFGKDGWERIAHQLAAAQSVILYHGTSTVFLNDIAEKGLLPRDVTGNSTYRGRTFGKKNLESKPNLIYLIHRSMIGFGGNPAVDKHGGELVGFRIHLTDLSRLVPDEDSRKDTWYESIAWEDSCAHEGPIPPERILGYVQRTRSGERYTPLRPDPQGIVALSPARW